METFKQRTKKDIYDQEYKKTNYDQVAIRVKKGKREEYQQAAENFGLGYGEMIRLAVEKFIADRSDEPFTKPVKPENQLSTEERKLIDAFNQYTQEGRKAIVKLVETLAPKNSDVTKEELK